MNQLGRIEIFLEVAKQQSFAKAAEQLGMSGPAASKQVMALEAELGVKLLHRTTRMVALTDEGARYYDRARLAVEELKEAAEQLQENKTVPKGPIRVSVPMAFGQMHLLPVLAAFAKKYPEVSLDVAFDDRTIDIVGEAFDVAIRIGVLNDSSLIARPLGDCPIYMVASPHYLETYGKPKKAADLKQHRHIAYSYQRNPVEWRYRDPAGRAGSIRVDYHFKTNDTLMMLQAAIDGVGMVQLPAFAVVNHMQAGHLVQVLPGYTTDPIRQITALMPPNRYRSARVKLLVDWLSQACKAMPLT